MKKSVRIGIIAVVGCCLAIAVFMFNNSKSVPINLELTESQKIEDFEYYYQRIQTSFPLFDEDKKTYGIDFLAKKDYYLDLIKKSKSNYEFYSIMSSLPSELMSFHAEIPFPNMNNYKELNCYLEQDTLNSKVVEFKAEYWNKYITNVENSKKTLQYAIFEYIDGKYISDTLFTTNKGSGVMAGDELLEINSQPVLDFYKPKASQILYRYDFKRMQTYKPRVVLNDSEGEKVKVKIKSKDGKICEKDLYFGIESESYWLSNSKDVYKIEEPTVYNYLDSNRNLSYIKISNFSNNNGEELKKDIEDSQKYSNVIIDLRGNWGGLTDYYIKYLYEPLFNKTVTLNCNWYMPDSDYNKKIIKELDKFNLFGLLGSKFSTVSKNQFSDSLGRSYVYTKESTILHGNSSNKSQKIYFLIDNKTGSAADQLISLVRQNKLGIIVGKNTAGEGTAGSFAMDVLPNSGLVFIYMPGISFNADGTSNSVYGTAPDIYCEQTIEDFNKQRDLQKNGVNIFDFNNRLAYDTVLKKTIAIMQD